MKKRDYYDLLEVSPTASAMDIIHAYRRAKLAFQEDSMATYSLFSDDDMEEIREQIEEAYHTLADSEKRREYDTLRRNLASLGGKAAEGLQPRPQRNSSDLQQRIASAIRFPGSFLNELREQQGISIQAIAERTRISAQYLKAIESEDESRFPETVYLKGYLRQYARELGLEPERVVKGYPPLMKSPEAEESPDNSD
ncbi:MAG TPA: helix-turn-helix domain-containing protein [Mariprofundaceae bacterium]|nr:helix-turn-helix domain-containing protein [Mariprofundaceae bacterium]